MSQITKLMHIIKLHHMEQLNFKILELLPLNKDKNKSNTINILLKTNKKLAQMK